MGIRIWATVVPNGSDVGGRIEPTFKPYESYCILFCAITAETATLAVSSQPHEQCKTSASLLVRRNTALSFHELGIGHVIWMKKKISRGPHLVALVTLI